MSLSDAAHTVMQRDIQWEIQVVWRGRAASLNLERVGAEGLIGFGICPEEADRDAILAVAEIAVPVGDELIVGELAGAAQDKWAVVQHTVGETRSPRNRGQKVATIAAAKLVALEIQESQRYGVNG